MIDGNFVLALIPARGGSKGIPRKNLVPVGGKPLIEWTIAAATSSRYVDEVVVSSDDEEVLNFSRGLGATCLIRPPDLASDEATAIDVIDHALLHGRQSDILVYLQPTSPLRSALDIDKSLQKLVEEDAQGVVSVVSCSEHPDWMFWCGTDGDKLSPVVPKGRALRRQDLSPTVRLNGAIYAARSELLSANGNILDLSLVGFLMPTERSIDVDSVNDLRLVREALEKGLATEDS